MRWYVAYTQAQAEMRAAQQLRNQSLEVFLPLCRRLRRHARRTETVLRPLFPRYLFVGFDIDSCPWRSIDGTRGVVHLVREGDHPAAVPDGVVEELRSRGDLTGVVPLSSLGLLERGRALLVTSGPFAGHVANYESLTGDQRVVLLLDLLGRSVRCTVPLLDVDAA